MVEPSKRTDIREAEDVPKEYKEMAKIVLLPYSLNEEAMNSVYTMMKLAYKGGWTEGFTKGMRKSNESMIQSQRGLLQQLAKQEPHSRAH